MAGGAIGAPPLTERPTGLLDLLGIKNGGQYPQTLSPVLAPVADLLDWYFQAQAVTGSVAMSLTTSGWQGNYAVPNGESWAILNSSIVTVGSAIPGTITSLNLTMAYGGVTPTTQPQVVLGQMTNWGASSFPMYGYDPPRLTLVPPGGYVGVQVLYAGTGTAAVNHNLRYVRLFL